MSGVLFDFLLPLTRNSLPGVSHPFNQMSFAFVLRTEKVRPQRPLSHDL